MTEARIAEIHKGIFRTLLIMLLLFVPFHTKYLDFIKPYRLYYNIYMYFFQKDDIMLHFILSGSSDINVYFLTRHTKVGILYSNCSHITFELK